MLLLLLTKFDTEIFVIFRDSPLCTQFASHLSRVGDLWKRPHLHGIGVASCSSS